MGRKRLSERHSIIFYITLGIIGASLFLSGCTSIEDFLQLFLTPQYETDLRQLEQVRALVAKNEIDIASGVNRKLAKRYADTSREQNDYVRMISVASRINTMLLAQVLEDRKKYAYLSEKYADALRNIKELEKANTGLKTKNSRLKTSTRQLATEKERLNDENLLLNEKNKQLDEKNQQLNNETQRLEQQIEDYKTIDLEEKKS